MSAKNLIIRGGADFTSVQKELARTQATLTAFKKGIGKTMLGIGAVLGGLSLGSLVKDVLQTSAKTETLNVAMAAVANSTGTSLDILKDYKKSVMALGIAEQEATQVMTRFMQSQLKVADAAKVVRVAQDAGTIAGMNSSEAAEQMVEAIAKLQPRLLTAFGFTDSLTDIYGAYAKAVGKTTSQLSQVEKKQAMVNYILREGTKIAGSYEAAMGTFGKKLGSVEKLSLPKKLMQELKTSLGAPLILPGAGAVLDGLIQQLDTLRLWAVDNEVTLRRWGQTVADAFAAVGKGFKAVTGVIANNWGLVKTIGIATGVSLAFANAQTALKGILTLMGPALQMARVGVLTYTLQMAAAPAATNIFTGALYSLRAALFAVHAALGPIGWAVLGITAAVSGGMALWSKYSNSLNNINVTGGSVAKSAGAVAEAIGDQAEALGAAGKAAKKSLVGFDEINQLQKDIAGGGGGALDDIDLGDIGEIGGGGGGLLDGLLDDIEIAKPTIKGFFEWMGDIWSDFVKGWGWVDSLSNWIVDTFYDAEKGVWSLKTAWGTWSNYVQSWGWVKGLTGWTVGVLESWDTFKNQAGTKWEGIKKAVKDKWSALKTDAGKDWGNIQTTIQATWGTLKKEAPVAWENIKTAIGTKTKAIKEDTNKAWVSIQEKTNTIWGEMKTSSDKTWEGIKTYLETVLNNIKTNTGSAWSNISTTMTGVWNTLELNASRVFGNIQTSILDAFDGVKKKTGGIWEDIWGTVKTYINKIISGMNTMIRGMNKVSWQAPDWVPGLGGKSFGISIPTMAALKEGTNFVRANGPAFLHQGEAVVPKKYNPAAGGFFPGVPDLGPLLERLLAAINSMQPAPAGGDINVYIGNEQVDAYVQRSQDRRNIRSNGR
ncbi:MAG: apolipoprotein A1/A4/E family protein [Firmicutes bacterium]|jgi:hypothetical protein|nr:apolipoprotein A1/A4/E family protein [Bacillota bacterium]